MKIRDQLILILAVILGLIISGCAKKNENPLASSGCGKNPPAELGKSKDITLAVDNLERTYRLHLPPDYDQDVPTGLVLAFHQYGSTAKSWEYTTLLSKQADEFGLITVYPQSTSFESAEGGEYTTWNDLTCSVASGPEGPTCKDMDAPFPPECGEPKDCIWCTCNDDLTYVDRMLDHLENTLCIDPAQVFATGFSNGAGLVHRLGCDRSDRFAAIAPAGATLARGFNCAPNTPTSIMHIHGTQDYALTIDGTGSWGSLQIPVQEVMADWAGKQSQNCSEETSTYQTSADGNRGWACTQHPNCELGSEVVFCTWQGSHSWPMVHVDLIANEAILEFFVKNASQKSPD